jgi:acetoin:2,6-dichlorophenolindophenol oxidoreductase subunit alpha
VNRTIRKDTRTVVNEQLSVREPDLGTTALLEGYRTMVAIRRFEEAIQRLFLRGEVHGTVHLCNGQEAVAVGVCTALGPDDVISATYRGHGVALACGSDPRALTAELMGRASGLCGGRAGSLNVVDREHGLLHCSGIIGGSIGCATGAALSARRAGYVSVAFFGDGTANQAYFHECLNFARVFELPLLLVCENNLYGEFTPMAQITAGADIAGRAAAAYDMRASKVDGNDLQAVHRAAVEAHERIREGGGPELIEALTYRQLGHSKTDPATYRPAEELEAWLARDPLLITRGQLADDRGVEEPALAEAEEQAAAWIAAAVEAALTDPFPDPAADPIGEYAP